MVRQFDRGRQTVGLRVSICTIGCTIAGFLLFWGAVGFAQPPDLVTAQPGPLQIEKIDPGVPHRGQNRVLILAGNATQSMLTVVVDLRAVPGLYFRNWQQQFVFLFQPGERRSVEVPYAFEHLATEGFLRVRMYFPIVSEAGSTTLNKPFLEKRFPVNSDNADLDPLPFRTRETAHYIIHFYPGSFAGQNIDQISAERDHGFEQIAHLLGVHLDHKIPLFLFPDADTKLKETGHQGTGMAENGMIVEVYSQQLKLDPYHETAHILAGQLGDPAAMFNEGFAVYASEILGADALRELGSPGRSCDSAVLAHRKKGEYIPLSQMLTFDDIGPDASRPTISYPEACSIVRYLIARFGMDKFKEAYAHINAGNTQAIDAIYGASIEDLERAWLAELQEH